MFAREWAGEGYEKGQTQLFYRAQLSQARTQAVNQLMAHLGVSRKALMAFLARRKLGAEAQAHYDASLNELCSRIAPIKIGKRRPNQETAQRLLNAGWQVKVMTGSRTLHEKLILIDYETVFFGSHNLAWSSISSNCELSACIEDEDLANQAEALFWQRWKLASDPDPNTWELATPLALPFVP